MRYGIIGFLLVAGVFLAVPIIAVRIAAIMNRIGTRRRNFFARRRTARKLPKATVRERDN